MTAVNEEAIPHALASLPQKELEELGFSVAIIISNGINSAKIAEQARNAGASVYTSPKGYGNRYKHIFSKSQADIIVAFDADGSNPASQIPALIKALENEGLDFVSVNRLWNMEKGAMSPIHKFGNYVLNLTTSILFGIYIIDSQSGMWAFRRNILKDLELHADGMAFSEEIKVEAISRYICREIPGVYKKPIGKVNLRSFYDSLGNLFFLFRKKLRIF